MPLSDNQSLFAQRYLTSSSGGLEPNAQPPDGIVVKRAFLATRWRAIPGELQADLDTLQSAVAAQFPAEDSAALGKAVQNTLGQLIADLQAAVNDAVDDAVNAEDGSYRAVGKVIAGLKARVTQDRLVAALRSNTLCKGQGFEAKLHSALDEINAKLVE